MIGGPGDDSLHGDLRSSTHVAALTPDYWQDPAQLHDTAASLVSIPKVTVSGDQLLLTLPAEFVGQLHVRLTAYDDAYTKSC